MTAPGTAEQAAAFQRERPRLVGLAYRMLGSVPEAEDVVSEAWLRFAGADGVRSPAAWLTTATTRLAIDRLRAQRRRREDYVGPWLPDPVPTAAVAGGVPPPDPADAATLADSLALGFLVVLDRLGPVERAVFLLADVFGTPFDEVAAATGRTPESCRQLAVRARRKVRAGLDGSAPADGTLLEGLVGALLAGDAGRVVDLLAPDVVLVSDGGPARRAARRPVVGADRVARFLVNLAARAPADGSVTVEDVNAAPALVVRAGASSLVLSVDAGPDGRVRAVRLVLNPDKLGALDVAPDLR